MRKGADKSHGGQDADKEHGRGRHHMGTVQACPIGAPRGIKPTSFILLCVLNPLLLYYYAY
jgi:hypothetical protein